MTKSKSGQAANTRSNGLSYVVFEVTPSCNLDCQYCYNIHKAPGATKPEKNSYKRAIATLKKLFRTKDITHVTFSGGEPFLAERFHELVLYCRMKGKTVTVISNGNVASKSDYRQLIDLGVSLIEFPFHSSSGEEHDTMTRRKGSWENARRSIETVLELGGRVVPVIVITKINRERIGDTLYMLEKIGCRRIMLNRFNVGGNGIALRGQLELTVEELRRVFREANTVAEEEHLRLSSNVCTPLCAIDPARYSQIAFTQCTLDLQRRPITMDVAGNIRFCNHSPIIVGNIFRDRLTEMVSSSYAKSWRTTIPTYCQNCDLWQKCLGGCRAASEQLGESLCFVDPLLRQQHSSDESSINMETPTLHPRKCDQSDFEQSR